ncbi:MAG: hypothetical protein COW13_03400 [Candidatus Omnitrophica bacterium CG12_big_fil_rev_8_21_14_0_65_50_5]|nr:MAG: hypothetical protein COW13_03400 [Candidatus Omnitrophica bacterium CG12_big_fil_rev_8_21_14_0_65_50_5]
MFVAPAAEEAPAEGFDAAGLKAALEEAFRGRLSHRFDIVQNEKEADLRVDISVLEYFWTDADPVDMIAGLAGVSYDVLTKENYARLEAIIKLTDGPNGAKLWEEKLKSTITSKTLTKEEAPALSNERLAKMLIRNLFKKHPRK